MANLNPYEPFLGEYKTNPSMRKMSDGSDWPGNPSGSGENQQLKVHTSFMRPRLLNKRNAHQGVERINQQFQVYWNDIFHTMLNMPRYRFLAIFFMVYILQYVVFAIFYISQPDDCLSGVHQFSHAMWFSVQTAATIGYGGELAPNPECTIINMMVVIQVIFSSLVDYLMMGLVFARFAAPSQRTATIRFSQSATLHQHSSGYWCISMRLANVRKHTVLQPEVQMLMAVPDSSSQSSYHFEELQVENLVSHLANLKLGLPAVITHVIRPGSPLFPLSLAAIEAQDLELVVFMDGIDAMTSNNLSARHSYYISDMRLNQTFSTIYLRATRQGRVGLDLGEFDTTIPAGATTYASQAAMRSKTFEQLAREAHLPTDTDHHHHPNAPPPSQPTPSPYYQQQVYRLGSESDSLLPVSAPAGRATASGDGQQLQAGSGAQVRALLASLLADPTASEALRRQAAQLQGQM